MLLAPSTATVLSSGQVSTAVGEGAMGVSHMVVARTQPAPGEAHTPLEDTSESKACRGGGDGCATCFYGRVPHRTLSVGSVWLPHGAEGGFDPHTAYKDLDWETYFGYLHGGRTNLTDVVRCLGDFAFVCCFLACCLVCLLSFSSLLF